MLKIGEIAGFCGIPVKTLRYYNEIDLLKPNYIDPLTKYRFYDEEQLKKLVLILDLKDIGFTLSEISSFLENDCNEEILLDLLKKKRIALEENIKLEELKLDNIESISSRILEGKYKESQVQNENSNKTYCEASQKVLTLDSCTSIDRHSLEEAIWL